MLKVVIVEDEKPILELMKVLIGRSEHYTIVGAFDNPLEALRQLQEMPPPDVAFLDVEMPKMNGLELAQKMNECFKDVRIVFTTAHKEYAFEAFRVYAFDYLLKPVMPATLDKVTARLLQLERPSDRAVAAHRQDGIRCFGDFEVRNRKGELIHWPTRKTEELFAYLLCHPNQAIDKRRLADLLWPGMPGQEAFHNLHNTVYRLKKILKEHEISVDVLQSDEGYLLDTMQGSYDALDFDMSDRIAQDSGLDLAEIERLCGLYVGPLFNRREYRWKLPLEERYRKQFVIFVRALVSHDLAASDWNNAMGRLEAALQLYPLQEELHLLLLEACVRSGQQERAAVYYAQVEALYCNEMEVELPREIQVFAAANGV